AEAPLLHASGAARQPVLTALFRARPAAGGEERLSSGAGLAGAGESRRFALSRSAVPVGNLPLLYRGLLRRRGGVPVSIPGRAAERSFQQSGRGAVAAEQTRDAREFQEGARRRQRGPGLLLQSRLCFVEARPA